MPDYKKHAEDLAAALGAILGDIDYTSGSCSFLAPIGAALNQCSLERGQEALKAWREEKK